MSNNSFHPIVAWFHRVTANDALFVTMDDDEKPICFPMGSWRCYQPMISFEKNDDIEFEAQRWILEKHELDHLIEE